MRSDRYAKQVSDPAMTTEIHACIRDTFPANTRIFFAREIAKTVRRYPGRYPTLAAYEKDLTRWVSRWIAAQGWDTYDPRTNATRWVIPAGFMEVAT